MLSTTPLRTLRTRACAGQRVVSKRFASHGAPHYNEPSGYLFAEKVRLRRSAPSLLLTPPFHAAASPWAEADERGLGKYLVYWDVR
jgi:hypothetical protein